MCTMQLYNEEIKQPTKQLNLGGQTVTVTCS